MGARLELHPLPGTKRAGAVAVLVERLVRSGERVALWLADEGRRALMDDYLWTFQQLAFVPHAVWSEGMGPVIEPVVLLGEPANPNGATVLVVGDGLPPEEWAASFGTVHDFLPPGEAGERRRAWWDAWRRRYGAP